MIHDYQSRKLWRRKGMLKKLKNQKGMTLVELLAVIVILGIISAIAIPSIGGLIENSKKDAFVANAQQMVSAAKIAYASSEATQSKELDPTGNPGKMSSIYSLTDLVNNGYLEEFIDPFTKGDISAENKNNSYVKIEKVGSKITYSVYLKSDSNSIGTSAVPVNSIQLKRSDVK